LIEDVYVHNIGGDSVQGSAGAQNVVVRRLTARYIRRQGVSFNNGSGFTLEDSNLEWVGRSIIDIEPYAATWVGDNIVLRRNTAQHFTNYFLAAGGDGSHNGMTVEDNNATGGLGFGIIGTTTRATRVVVRRNTYYWNDPDYVRGTNLGDFAIRASDNVVVEDNNFRFNSETSVDIFAPGGNIQRNTFAGVDDGLLVDTGGTPQNITVQGNTVTTRSGSPAPIVVY
jgi:hypothetical protein